MSGTIYGTNIQKILENSTISNKIVERAESRQNKNLSNSEIVFNQEFERVFARKEYTQAKVQLFFRLKDRVGMSSATKQLSLSKAATKDRLFNKNGSLINKTHDSDLCLNSDPKSTKNENEDEICHSCCKYALPERGLLSKMFNSE